jgi:hypothetical protein
MSEEQTCRLCNIRVYEKYLKDIDANIKDDIILRVGTKLILKDTSSQE